jgi:hypothetical protein
LSAIRHAHIHITTNNQAPIAEGESYTILPNGQLTLSAPGPLVNDFDPDGDAIQFVLVDGPTSGTLTFAADGSLVYRPGAVYTAVDTIRYRVTDGRLYSEIVELRVNTLAVAIQEPVVPQTPPPDGPIPGSESTDDSRSNNTALETESAVVEIGSSISATQAMGVLSSEATVADVVIVTRDVLARQLQLDERDLQSIGWVFGQDLREIRDRDQGDRGASRLSISDYLVAMLPPDDQDSRDPLMSLNLESAIIATANATLSAATAGTIFWALRGAALVATIATGMPALRNLDPANLLAEYRSRKPGDEEADELETMIEKPQAKK